jgi:asparagine synthase (glutamine-hydrolysing)
MSGICGFFGDGDKYLLKKMLKSIQHRGGKEYNQMFDTCGFGITAAPSDDRRMYGFNEQGSVYVALDGEIDNRDELLGMVDNGLDDNNLSNPEILCLLYDHFGTKFIEKIVGPFVFVLWDDSKKVLLVARDRLGEKPLCYYNDSDVFLFSSEIKGFLSYDEFRVKINSDSLTSYLTYLFVPTPHSIFDGVVKLPPGHYLTLQHHSNYTVKKYWDFRLAPLVSLDEKKILEKMDESFTDSVTSRMSQPKSVGVFLSAGIDSNIVASKASRISNKIVHTFTLGFDNEQYNELKFAREAAEYYGTAHQDFEIGVELFDYLPQAIWHMDEPHGDSGLLSLFFISKKVREKGEYKILTGDGGDELFWGYPWNLETDLVDNYFKIPRFLRRCTHAVIDRMPMLSSIDMVKKSSNLKKYEEIGYPSLSSEEKFLARISSFTPCELTKLYSKKYRKQCAPPPLKSDLLLYFETHKNIDMSYVKGYATMKTVFLDNGLYKGDRMMNAFSIDVNHPLLDMKFVDLSMKIPSDLKIHKGVQKYIWKKYADTYNLIPKKLLHLKKKGFGIPIEYWFTKTLKSYLEQEILEKKCMKKYFNEKYLNMLFKNRAHYENAHRLFSLLSFSVWYDKFIPDG